MTALKKAQQRIAELEANEQTLSNRIQELGKFVRHERDNTRAREAELAAMRATGEPVAWAATSEEGIVEALGMNQSRRFDTPLYTHPQTSAQDAKDAKRYCWLFGPRTTGETNTYAGTVGNPLRQDAVIATLQGFYMAKEQVDNLIDAAITAQQGEES